MEVDQSIMDPSIVDLSIRNLTSKRLGSKHPVTEYLPLSMLTQQAFFSSSLSPEYDRIPQTQEDWAVTMGSIHILSIMDLSIVDLSIRNLNKRLGSKHSRSKRPG
jgi:hypothetical protein